MRKLQVNSAQIFPLILLAMRGKPPLSTATHARGWKVSNQPRKFAQF